MKNINIQKAVATILLFSQSLPLTSTAHAADPTPYQKAGTAQGDVNGKGKAKSMAILLAEKVGSEKGFAQGHTECANEHRNAVYNIAFGASRKDATIEAPVNATRDAEANAEAQGKIQGTAQGEARADADARQNAAGPGRQAGLQQANNSDASARGAQDGKAAGDIEAREYAVANDYPAARKAYYSERFAEAPKSSTQIVLTPGLTPTNETASTTPATLHNNFAAAAFALTSDKAVLDAAHFMAQVAALNVIVPDEKPTDGAELAIKYCKTPGNLQPQAPAPAADPATPDAPAPQPVNEYEKCVDEFRAAYDAQWIASFKAEYPVAYTNRYNESFERNRPLGCKDANQRATSYRNALVQYPNAVRRDGVIAAPNVVDTLQLALSYRDGYAVGYKQVYDVKYNEVYNAKYPVLLQQKTAHYANLRYNQVYDAFYAREFEKARAAAYSAQVTALYNAAYAQAKKAEFEAKYPGYQKAEIARGRADEALEFTRVPVRIVRAEVQESVSDGIMEAGERIMVNFSIRNFSDQKINPADLQIKAKLVDQTGAAIPGSVSVLPQALEPKSLTHVVGALDIRPNEAGYGREVRVQITWTIKNQDHASNTALIKIVPNTLTRVELANLSEVRLGYPGQLQIKVTNQSTKPLPETATLAFQTQIPGIVFSNTTAKIADPANPNLPLKSGASILHTIPFVNNTYASSQPFKFVASVKLNSGRDIGLLDRSMQVASVQDYAFSIKQNQLEDLRKKTGLFNSTNIPFTIANISNRIATQSLTVELSIESPDASAFSWPNGKVLSWNPIKPGFQSEGKVKVKVSKKNGGGTLVMTVKEGGKLIGIVRRDF